MGISGFNSAGASGRRIACFKRNMMSGAATGVLVAILFAGAARAQQQESTSNSYALKIMGFNIWNNGQNSKMWDPAALARGEFVYNDTMKNLLTNVHPDILVMPELYNNNRVVNGINLVDAHANNTLDVLNGLAQKQDSFGAYQRPAGSDIFTSLSYQQVDSKTIVVSPGNGFPTATVRSIHLNYFDAPTTRLGQAKTLNQQAEAAGMPTILVGDFNAGDVSERGLHRASQQKLVLMGAAGGNAYYQTLARQYAQMAEDAGRTGSVQFVETYIANRNTSAAIPDTVFVDETYPVLDNLPVTMNLLKKDYQLIQLDRNREMFEPNALGNDRTTWTSVGEDGTNTWPSWDRVTIDHVMVSRPYAKWVEIVDSGDYTGNLWDDALLPPYDDGRPAEQIPNRNASLSDHEPVAQEIRWIGPRVESAGGGNARLIFDASGPHAGKEFQLSRNNRRDDVYLGQISDANGSPIFSRGTSTDEFLKTRLDCSDKTMLGLQGAKDMCVDDHSKFTDVTITDGRAVAIDEAEALGARDGVLTLDNGLLRTAGTADAWADWTGPVTAIDKQITLGDGGGWISISNAEVPVVARQAISGVGHLAKLGAGTLELGAANSYSGGTLVEAGTLRAGTTGAFVEGTDYAVNGGALDLNGFDLTMASLSGTGGKVTLGTAGLTVDQAADTAFAGELDGSGDFTKTGTGKLLLLGDNSAFAGTTTVSGGGLFVGNSQGGKLGGALDIGAGGVLGGTGTIGSAGKTVTIEAGGVHAPGNSIGPQVIDADYVNHGTLAIEADPTAADKLIVNGTVDIAGAALDLMMTPATAAGWGILSGPYAIIENDGADAVTGEFAGITKNLVFLDALIDYAGGDGNDVTLELARNDVAFTDAALTRNQTGTAAAIDTLDATSEVWTALALAGSEEQARALLDELSGEVHASLFGMFNQDSRFWRNAANDRLRGAFNGVAASGQQVMGFGAQGLTDAPADTQGLALWTRGFGSWARTDSDGNAAEFTRNTGGILAGADMAVAETTRLGMLAGYARSSFDADDRGSSGDADSFQIGLYGGTQVDALGLRAGVAYARHDVETERRVLGDKLTADYDAGTVQVFGEAGYAFDLDSLWLEPFANAAYVSTRIDDFSENGGPAALSIDSETSDNTFTTLGLRAAVSLNLGEMPASFRAMAGWRHAFGDVRPEMSLAFEGSESFGITGAPVARDAAVLEAGFDLALSPDATFGLAYNGEIGGDAQDHGLNATLEVKF